MRTERLRLRPFTIADVDLLVELDSDPEVMRYLTNGQPTPRAAIADGLLPRLIRQYADSPGLGRWAAHVGPGDTFIGWLALDPQPGNEAELGAPTGGPGGEAELGYRLRRAAWGNGYATEGARALVRYAFEELGLDRVYARTMAVNERSRAVMERAGLRYARTFHLTFEDPIPGTELGEVEYELRRPDYLTGTG
jgi:RimJ/RimL family protein N-acetyltransferase